MWRLETFILGSPVPLSTPRQVPQKMLASGIWMSWQGLCRVFRVFSILSTLLANMILLAGQAIIMPLSKVQKFGMKIEMTFPDDMQAYFGNVPHPSVHEKLGLSVDSLSGCLAKLVCIHPSGVMQLLAGSLVVASCIKCLILSTCKVLPTNESMVLFQKHMRVWSHSFTFLYCLTYSSQSDENIYNNRYSEQLVKKVGGTWAHNPSHKQSSLEIDVWALSRLCYPLFCLEITFWLF